MTTIHKTHLQYDGGVTLLPFVEATDSDQRNHWVRDGAPIFIYYQDDISALAPDMKALIDLHWRIVASWGTGVVRPPDEVEP